MRRSSGSLSEVKSDATRFHEFASSDEEIEDWIQASTCHRSRLTVSDTLKKENDIRQLVEEAEEEALEEEEEAADEGDDSQNEYMSELDEDDGFQTDDEEGFAESDDDSNDGSDYEWWAPNRSANASPFVPSDYFRLTARRTASDSSLDRSGDEATSPLTRQASETRIPKKTRPVHIRPSMPELPDSTDFVCGTLDEDRPLEQAYISRKLERKALKHRVIPQDIDPTFPTSDNELVKEDEEDDVEDDLDDKVTESDHPARMHSDTHGNESRELRGRKHSSAQQRSPEHSQRRLRSPPAPVKRGRSPAPPTAVRRGRSPAPRGLFFGSPTRNRSPPPLNRLTSPPPSRRGSATTSPVPINMAGYGQAMLGQRNHELTHTASLPRSPHPFARRRRSSNITTTQDSHDLAATSDVDEDDDDDKPYTRGAIDIVQGLETKRMKRREKLYRVHSKREEKRKPRRPTPGLGAQREVWQAVWQRPGQTRAYLTSV